MSQPHLIDEFIFDISFEKVDTDFVQDDYLQALLVDALLPMADLELSRYSDRETHIKFELLEIDLGDIPSDAFKEEISRRFPAALRDALERTQLSTAVKVTHPSANLQYLSDINDLKDFLFTGRMPWHTALNDHAAHQKLLNRLVLERVSELLPLISNATKNSASVRRLSQQFSSSQLLSIFEKSDPARIDVLGKLVEDLRWLFRKMGGVDLFDTTIRDIIWLPLLTEIDRSLGQPFAKSNLLSILSHALANLAQKTGRSTQDLLTQLRKFDLLSECRSGSSLPELIFDLSKKVQIAAPPSLNSYEEVLLDFGRLKDFLTGSTVFDPDDFNVHIHFELMLSRLSESNVDRWFQKLIQILTNSDSRHRLIHYLPERQLIALLKKIVPVQSSFLAECIEQIKRVLIEIEPLKIDAKELHDILWQHLLDDVVISISSHRREIQFAPILKKVVSYYAKKINREENLLWAQIQDHVLATSKSSVSALVEVLAYCWNKKSQSAFISNSTDIYRPPELEQLERILFDHEKTEQYDVIDQSVIDAMINRLLADFPDQLFQAMTTGINNSNDVDRLIQSFSRHQRIEFIKVLLPLQADLLCELIDQLESLFSEKKQSKMLSDDIHGLIWHQVLLSALAPDSSKLKEVKLNVILDKTVEELGRKIGNDKADVLIFMLAEIESGQIGSFQLLSDTLRMMTAESRSSTKISVVNGPAPAADFRIDAIVSAPEVRIADQIRQRLVRALMNKDVQHFTLLWVTYSNDFPKIFIDAIRHYGRFTSIREKLILQLPESLLIDLLQILDRDFFKIVSIPIDFPEKFHALNQMEEVLKWGEWKRHLLNSAVSFVLDEISIKSDLVIKTTDFLNQIVDYDETEFQILLGVWIDALPADDQYDSVAKIFESVQSARHHLKFLLEKTKSQRALAGYDAIDYLRNQLFLGQESYFYQTQNQKEINAATDDIWLNMISLLMSDYRHEFISFLLGVGRSEFGLNPQRLNHSMLEKLKKIFFSYPLAQSEIDAVSWIYQVDQISDSASKSASGNATLNDDAVVPLSLSRNEIVVPEVVGIASLPIDVKQSANEKIDQLLGQLSSGNHSTVELPSNDEELFRLIYIHLKSFSVSGSNDQSSLLDAIDVFAVKSSNKIAYLRKILEHFADGKILDLDILQRFYIDIRTDIEGITVLRKSLNASESASNNATFNGDTVVPLSVSRNKMVVPEVVGISSLPIDVKQSANEKINLLLGQLSSGMRSIVELPLNEGELFRLISMYLKTFSMSGTHDQALLLDAIDVLAVKSSNKIAYLRKILEHFAGGKILDLNILERFYNDIQTDIGDLIVLQKSLRDGEVYLYSLDVGEVQLNRLVEITILQGQTTLGNDSKNFLSTIEDYAKHSKNKKQFLQVVLQTLLDKQNLDLDAIVEDSNRYLDNDQRSSSVLPSAYKPYLEQPASLYILVVHFLSEKKGQFLVDRRRFIDAVDKLLLRDPFGLHRLFKESVALLRANQAYLKLIEVLPERLLTRFLLLLRPEDHADIQKSADIVGNICLSELTFLHPAAVKEHKWIYLFENLLMQSSIYLKKQFVEELLSYLLPKVGVTSKDQHERLKNLACQKLLITALIPDKSKSSLLPTTDELHQPTFLGASEVAPSTSTKPASAILSKKLLNPYAVDEDFTEEIYLANAGLVLAAPYLPRLFSMLSLTDEGSFVDVDASERAVHLLEFMVNCRTVAPEYQLTLNKLICGIKTQAPIISTIDITEKETDVIEGLLRSIIHHWKTIGSTTISGLREAFFQRKGILQLREDAWHLQVQPGTFDMLLDRLPWSISVIKYPWMERPIHVKWR